MRLLPLVATMLIAALANGAIADNDSIQEDIVVTVDSTNLRFSPSSVTLTEGDSVRFFWSGELLAHNAVARDGLFDSGDPERDVDFTFTFDIGSNGTHEYVCEPHEEFGMTGVIIVEPLETAESGDEDSADEGSRSISGFNMASALAILALTSMVKRKS